MVLSERYVLTKTTAKGEITMKHPRYSHLKMIAFSSIIALFFIPVKESNNLLAQSLPLTGHEVQSISLSDAVTLTRNFRISSPSTTVYGEYFSKDAIQGMLAQTAAVGIRVYYGRKSDGTPVLVLVAVNANGQDMSAGLLTEDGLPCPPICDTTKTLSR